MAYLEIRNISKKFGDNIALKNVSFEVNEGEVFAIAGPPGAGKTTLLKVIAGLISPDEGNISLEGKDVTLLPPSKRNIGMVFEVAPVYPDRTGFENIAFPLKLQKLQKDQIEKRVYEIAELLGIKHLLNRLPSTYSGGEYQRVALARALVRNPKILLLDEPLRNLDAKIQESMRSWLKKLQRELKTTIVYSTSDPVDAMAVGDRVGVMFNGSLHQIGSSSEIYLKPKSLVVAEYVSIPALNTLTGTISGISGNNVEIDIGGFLKIRKCVSASVVEKLMSKKEIVVGIRPRDIEIHEGPPTESTISGKLSLIQRIGSEMLAYIEVDNSILRIVLRGKLHYAEGSTITLMINPEKVYLFDVETGEAFIQPD